MAENYEYATTKMTKEEWQEAINEALEELKYCYKPYPKVYVISTELARQLVRRLEMSISIEWLREYFESMKQSMVANNVQLDAWDIPSLLEYAITDWRKENG